MIHPLIHMWGGVFWSLTALLVLFCFLCHVGACIFSARHPWFEARMPIWVSLTLFALGVLTFSDAFVSENPSEKTMTWHLLFALWTIPFWLLVVAECSFLFFVVSYRWTRSGLASIAAFALALQFLGGVPVFPWMWEHWDWCIYIAIGWLGLAAPWAITKWTLFVRDNSIRYDEILDDFRPVGKNPPYPEDANNFTIDQKIEWQNYFNRNSNQDDTYEYNRVEFSPEARNHKADITGWMIFLPFSFLWTIANDPIRKIGREMYRLIVGWLNDITDRYWKDKRGHMPTVAEINANTEAKKAALAAEAESKRAASRSAGGYSSSDHPVTPV